MQSAVQSLVQQHDLAVVAIAAFICALSSLTGITMAERTSRSSGRRRLIWAGCTAIAVGFGIWTTHFVAMLSYDPGFLIGYAPFGTALSLVVAVVFTGIGVLVGAHGRPVTGGSIVGLGIAAMHYIGMNAIAIGGEVVWREGIVTVSVVIAALMAAAAFTVAARGTGWRARLGASGLLTLAICGLHFTGMAALDLGACFAVVDEHNAVEMGYAVTIGSILALSAGLMARFMDARDERRAKTEEDRLLELANVASEGLLTSIGGVVLSCNQSLRSLVGIQPGARLSQMIGPEALSQLREAPGTLIKAEIEGPNGPIPVEATLRYLHLSAGLCEAFSLRDLRRQNAMEAEAAGAVASVIDSERRLRLLIQSVTDYAIYMLDPEGNVGNWNAGAERNKGYTAAEIVGRNFACFFSDEDRAAGVPQRALDRALRDGKLEAEGWRYRKDGSRFWGSVLIEPIYNDDGTHLGFAKITHDNTAQRAAAERLATTQRNLELAMSNMSQGLALFDADGRMLLANERLSALLGLPDCGEGADQSVLVRALAERSDLGTDSVEDALAHHRQLLAARHEAELVQDLRDGRTLRIVHRPVPEGGWLSTYVDISERRRSEEQIVHMARHDALTGLPNRVSFVEHIAWALDAAAANTDKRVAVLGIDLDRFKEINDHLGHSVGDAVLKAVGQGMQAALLPNEFVSRFGGDEFAAFISYRTDAELHGFIERLNTVLSGRLVLDEHDLSVGASIGVAIYPDDAMIADKLIANADMAMYRAKASISETVCFYQAEMDEVARERRMIARDLWSAIEHEEFHLNYQIQKSVVTGATTGYEVLLRWNHPERGPVSPADFIPIAEECGAILPIGEWVLRTACREAASWPDSIRIAVNLSPVQLGNTMLVEMIEDVLAETGLAPWRLELEVTESAIIADKTRALHMLRRIKALGVTIAIDDFGTGYSSLETLRAFPFDKIKLDRSFMREVETSKQAKAIIRAILALGRSLEVPVLAEGVETIAQLALLRNEGCDEAQGFLLGRPKALDALPELMATGRVA